jgi:cytoplasmic iron level regulating protein YaaA (DUF328/UPF0246 family)
MDGFGDFGGDFGGDLAVSTPIFQARALELAAVARGFSVGDFQEMMGISANLAALTVDRFALFGGQLTKPAIFAFAGDTYQGLEAASLDGHELAWAQDHLRILSGLYGVLRPLDVIEPYRLEMGSRFPAAEGKTLYDYWGVDIASSFNAQAEAVGAEVLVNCASQEYFRAVDLDVLSLSVITPVFKDMKNGEAKIISFFAKKARGAMARFIVQNNITAVDDLKRFAIGGYAFAEDESDDRTLTFIRR